MVIYSKHAQARLKSRSIPNIDIEKAFDDLQSKQARIAIIVCGVSFFVVSVPNRTVITVLDKKGMHTFTNLDAVCIL